MLIAIARNPQLPSFERNVFISHGGYSTIHVEKVCELLDEIGLKPVVLYLYAKPRAVDTRQGPEMYADLPFCSSLCDG